MSGALAQLVSKGAQDVYIQNNIKIINRVTKFTRYNNFSLKPQQILFPQEPKNKTLSIVHVDRAGDLLTGVWLESAPTSNIVHHLIGTNFKLYIGGQLIDQQDETYLTEIWPFYMAENSTKGNYFINNNSNSVNKHFFPLHFFFCDHDMFLPLISLQYGRVEIHIEWGDKVEEITDLKMYGHYGFIDINERKYLSSTGSQYLITQVQRIPHNQNNDIQFLRTLNHPIKAIFFGYNYVWVGALPSFEFDSLSFQINDSFLFQDLSQVYFTGAQPYYFTTNAMDLSCDGNTANLKNTRFYMYSFGNKVSTYDISGTCNFSRIESAILRFKNPVVPASRGITTYAVNYNILRIQSGMAGLLFSN
jgi:hypothetical protein